MRANRAYELRVRRTGHGLALFAPDRVDCIEVIEIESGEVVLFWDVAARQTGRLARALRSDLAQLDAEDFLRRWRRHQSP
jgi:enhancing lycopene biosynthesis protein 2